MGVDHQTDTYFSTRTGRLKLRQGNIENNLIYYERSDSISAKESRFQLINVHDAEGLKQVLAKSVGVRIVVEKKREIYFIGNVKFHIDEVAGLGCFAEIEASNLHHDTSKEELQKQCNFYMAEFGIKDEDLIAVSYSDMLLAKADFADTPLA